MALHNITTLPQLRETRATSRFYFRMRPTRMEPPLPSPATSRPDVNWDILEYLRKYYSLKYPK